MLDTVVKCLELVRTIIKIKREVANTVAHYHRLCDRAIFFDKLLANYQQQTATITVAESGRLEKLLDVLERISQLADKFPKNTILGNIRHVLLREHYAGEVFKLNSELSDLADDLSFTLDLDFEARRRQDQQDLVIFLSSSVERVIEEIHTLQNDPGDSQSPMVQEACRKAVQENFQYLKGDLMRAKQEICACQEDFTIDITSAVQNLITEIGDKQTILLKQMSEGVKAVQSDVKDLHRKIDVLMELVQDVVQGKVASTPDKLTARKEILRRLDKTSAGRLQVLDHYKLGKGTYGEVFYGSFNDSIVAVKRIPASDGAHELAIHNELIVMDIVKGHPKVLGCLGFVLEPSYFAILLELMPFGSLSQMLYNRERFGLLPVPLLLAWGCDMADALCHIHSLKVKHGDIKAENFLLTHDLHLKLCDFGTAKNQDTLSLQLGPVGTFAFMAPEVASKKGASLASDIYSWAITMVQLLTRGKPSSDRGTYNLIEDALASIKSNDLRDLLEGCTFYDEKKMASINSLRPSAPEVFRRMDNLLNDFGGDPRSSFSSRDECAVAVVNGIRETALKLLAEREKDWRSSFMILPVIPPVPVSQPDLQPSPAPGLSSRKPLAQLSVEECIILVKCWGFHELVPFFDKGKDLSPGGLALAYISTEEDVKAMVPEMKPMKLRIIMDHLAHSRQKGVDIKDYEDFMQKPPQNGEDQLQKEQEQKEQEQREKEEERKRKETGLLSHAKYKVGDHVEYNHAGEKKVGDVAKVYVVDNKLVYDVKYPNGSVDQSVDEQHIHTPSPRTPPPLMWTAFTNKTLREAVNLWCSDRTAAERQYGHISDFDTSRVTNMSGLFIDMMDFNDDISRWDVSQVMDMLKMFYNAAAFNQPIGEWNVSRVTNMKGMFNKATAFNMPIGQWNVSHVTDMSYMFREARSFNQPIEEWTVSGVTNMQSMFWEATSFNQPLGYWNVGQVTNMANMFWKATSFDQPIGLWDVSLVVDMCGMFNGAIAFNRPIGDWTVNHKTNIHDMFDGSGYQHPRPTKQ